MVIASGEGPIHVGNQAFLDEDYLSAIKVRNAPNRSGPSVPLDGLMPCAYGSRYDHTRRRILVKVSVRLYTTESR